MNNPVKVTVRIPEETKKDLEAISFFLTKVFLRLSGMP